MNLYRSFGNLMEAWVSEGGGRGDHDDDDDPPDPGTNPRSESVDSGVETASSDASLPADAFASTPQSPALSSPVASSSSSSSSPHVCLSRALERGAKVDPEAGRAIRRRPEESPVAGRHAPALTRGQRSYSLGPRRPGEPSAPTRQTSEVHRRPLSLNYDRRPDQTRPEDLGGKSLSPGLSYLEQVCRMLEEVARQQMHSRALQTEVDALRGRGDARVRPDVTDSLAGGTGLLSETAFSSPNSDAPPCRRLQEEDELQKHRDQTAFRRRSASDTAATLHSRTLKVNCRGQHLSTNDLLEQEEEVSESQESKTGETAKKKKNWKLKIGSLKREGSGLRDTKSQQTQSSEKKFTRRRLSQLFRRRRKTE